MKRFFKNLIVTVAVLAVLAAIVVTLLFTLVNNYKFMTFTTDRISKSYQTFNAAFQSKSVKLIAHRGLSAEEYQNTSAAFKLAAQDADVWAIETDVWVTGDGQFLCMHDANSLEGVDDIRNVTRAQALQIPLKKKGKSASKYPDTYYAPTFEEYLSICKAGGKVAMIELKDKAMSNDEIDRLLAVINEVGAAVNFGSFHFSKLKYIRSKNSEVGLHLFTFTGLARDMADAGFTAKDKMKAVIAQRINLSCEYSFLTKSLAKQFHDAGLKVGVWTVNNGKAAVCLVDEYGVDYITTDYRKSELFK